MKNKRNARLEVFATVALLIVGCSAQTLTRDNAKRLIKRTSDSKCQKAINSLALVEPN